MTNANKLKVLIVGYGDLGCAIADRLTRLNIQVFGVARTNKEKSSVEIIKADVTEPLSLHILHSIKPDVIVYCVAAGGQTDEQYQQAYVAGLRNILLTQADNSQLKHVFFVSSTRVYGQVTDALLDESSPAMPSDFGGERLLEAESLLSTLHCTTTVLRLSGIYGPGRLRMINLAKSPERWPHQNSWTNRIHRDDAANFIVYLLQRLLAGQPVASCYVVTDSSPVRQYEVLNWISDKLNLTTSEPDSMGGGKRLSNHGMLTTGFTLQYPDYKAGYATLIQQIGFE